MNSTFSPWKTHVKGLCREISKAHDFSLYSPTFLLRTNDEIAQFIHFEFPPSGMQIHIAVQPLYAPSRLLHYTFGYRPERKNYNVMGEWGSNPARIIEDIEELRSMLVDVAQPFFSATNSPQKIVDFITNRAAPGLKTTVNSYLAYSFLKIGEYRQASVALETLVKTLNQSPSTFKDRIEEAKTLLEYINEENYNGIDFILSHNVAYLEKKYKIAH